MLPSMLPGAGLHPVSHGITERLECSVRLTLQSPDYEVDRLPIGLLVEPPETVLLEICRVSDAATMLMAEGHSTPNKKPPGAIVTPPGASFSPNGIVNCI